MPAGRVPEDEQNKRPMGDPDETGGSIWPDEEDVELFSEIEAMMDSLGTGAAANHPSGIWDETEGWDQECAPLLEALVAKCGELQIPFQFHFLVSRTETDAQIRSGIAMSEERKSCEMVAASMLLEVPHSLSHFIMFLRKGKAMMEKGSGKRIPTYLAQDVTAMYGAALAVFMMNGGRADTSLRGMGMDPQE